jgi:lysophospholipase L1-like esterase
MTLDRPDFPRKVVINQRLFEPNGCAYPVKPDSDSDSDDKPDSDKKNNRKNKKNRIDRTPPIARLNALNLTTTNSTAYTFKAVYKDETGIRANTIDSNDLTIIGPNGVRYEVSHISVKLRRSGTVAQVIYSFTPPDGIWDTADNGNYTVKMQENQVKDRRGNSIRAGTLGEFKVIIPTESPVSPPTDPPPTNPPPTNPPPTNPPSTDSQPPTATLSAVNVSTDGSSAYQFSVTFSDDQALNVGSFDNSDIRVTGPTGFTQLATLVGVDTTSNGTPRTATYQITPPGGTWDGVDAGAYTLAIEANQVIDTSGNAIAATPLGTFTVSNNAPTVTGFTAPTVTADSTESTFTVTFSDDIGINVSSIDSGDIQVTGPYGFSQIVTLVDVDDASNGTLRTATYRITAPNGSWDINDNGTYTLSLLADQVRDTGDNAVAAGSVGTFQVALSGGNTADYSGLSKGINANLGTGIVLRPVYGGIFNPDIMPLGDSITSGQHTNAVPGAYRIQLFENFTNDGIAINFVGTQTNGPTSGFDQNHEGYPGASIGDSNSSNNITQRVPTIFTANSPDVVLLMIGTNDTAPSRFVSVNEMLNDLEVLIDDITSAAPNALVLVSSIAPHATDNTRNGRISSYNNALPGLVDALNDPNVVFVDAGGSLATSDIGSDGIHPTAPGYDKLGNAWYDALAERDVLTNTPNIIGTNFVDTITGSDSANIIQGGGGSDRLTGGAGADSFVYNNSNQGGDTITDFTPSDFFRISATGFGAGLASGVSLSTTASATGVLVNGSNSISGNATFLYSGGTLRFDADGTGAGAAVAIATLSSGPTTLNTNQFIIV